MNTCLICLEDSDDLINPKNCSCKIFLHEECLKKCESYGIQCPICRKRKNYPNVIIHEFNNFELNNIHYSPYQYVHNLIFGTIILLFVIVPLLLFVGICYLLKKYNFSFSSYTIFPLVYFTLMCFVRR